MFLGTLPPQFACNSTKYRESLFEYHDKQVVNQLYPRNARCATCLANMQAREMVIPAVFQRKFAQSSPHVAGNCNAEI